MPRPPDGALTAAARRSACCQEHLLTVTTMNKRNIIIVGTLGMALVAGTAGVAAASSGGDDTERPITGDALVQASHAALDHTGRGSVTETEVGDEDSMYEVEVTLDDGSQVDVQLDTAFRVVGSAADVEDDGTEGADD
jgi:hypothetical protein